MTTDPAAEDPRIVGLRRMRILATLLLVAMTAIFIATYFVDQGLPGLGYLRAFAEAGMVGACADWFAVVALFRHPLGIPIPHTAIVPHNKARIAGAMGRFITNNFLTPKVLSERLAGIDAARWIGDWLANGENARRVSHGVALTVPQLVQELPRERLADVVERSVWRGLEAMPAGPVASSLLAIVWAQGQTQKLLERCLELAETSLEQNKAQIRARIEAGSSRWIPRWVDGIVADKVIAAAASTLVEMRDPAHPWRLELKTTVERLIGRLASDSELQARVESAKAELIANPLLREQVHSLWAEIEGRLPSDVSAYSGQIETAVSAALTASGRWLQENPAVKTRLNRWMRILIRRAIVPRRAEIGAFVTEVVNRWDATTLVNRMELQVGKDLQYIRINGTLVGGLVGLIIYSTTRWFFPG
jgi:uncharacterized membrane-anchored protein YjiN (DUF445 family)